MSDTMVDITRYGFSILQIETMSRCNMECDFCGYPLRRDKMSVLPEETVLKTIDSVSAVSGLQHLCLSQFNEPLLDGRIYKFIAHAKSRSLPVMIITNGLLLRSPDVVSRLVEAAPSQIKVSLQVLNAGLFSRIRKAGGDFIGYKRGIGEFVKVAQHAPLEITIDIACNFLTGVNKLRKFLGFEYGDPSVYDTVGDLRSDLKEFLLGLQEFLPSYTYSDSELDRYLADVSIHYTAERGLKISGNVSLKIKPFIYGRRIESFYPVKRSRPCTSKILGVLASGSVVPCCMAYDDAPSLGNVRTEPLRAILENSARLLDAIRGKGQGLPAPCQHCLGAPTRRGAALKKLRYVFRQDDRRSMASPEGPV